MQSARQCGTIGSRAQYVYVCLRGHQCKRCKSSVDIDLVQICLKNSSFFKHKTKSMVVTSRIAYLQNIYIFFFCLDDRCGCRSDLVPRSNFRFAGDDRKCSSYFITVVFALPSTESQLCCLGPVCFLTTVKQWCKTGS